MGVMLYAIHLSYFADMAHCQSFFGPYFLITLGLIQLALCHTSKDKSEIKVWCTTFPFVMVVLNEVKQDLGWVALPLYSTHSVHTFCGGLVVVAPFDPINLSGR